MASLSADLLLSVPDVRVFRCATPDDDAAAAAAAASAADSGTGAGAGGGASASAASAASSSLITHGELLVLRAPPASGGEPITFLMIKDFQGVTYPLTPGAHVLLVGRTLMAPTSEDARASLGLTVGDGASEDQLTALVYLVATVCTVHDKKTGGIVTVDDVEGESEGKGGEAEGEGEGAGGRVARAEKLAAKLESGSKVVAAGAVKAGGFLGGKIKAGGAALKNRIKPKEEAVVVSANTKSALVTAKFAAKGAVTVTTGILEGLTVAATSIGKAAVGAAKDTKYGAKVSAGASTETGEAVKVVAGASLVAIANIVKALDQASVEVLKETGSATAELIDHRYGEDAGAAARDAADATVGLYKATINMSKTGPMALTRIAATEVAKEEMAKREGSEPGPGEALTAT